MILKSVSVTFLKHPFESPLDILDKKQKELADARLILQMQQT